MNADAAAFGWTKAVQKMVIEEVDCVDPSGYRIRWNNEQFEFLCKSGGGWRPLSRLMRDAVWRVYEEPTPGPEDALDQRPCQTCGHSRTDHGATTQAPCVVYHCPCTKFTVGPPDEESVMGIKLLSDDGMSPFAGSRQEGTALFYQLGKWQEVPEKGCFLLTLESNMPGLTSGGPDHDHMVLTAFEVRDRKRGNTGLWDTYRWVKRLPDLTKLPKGLIELVLSGNGSNVITPAHRAELEALLEPEPEFVDVEVRPEGGYMVFHSPFPNHGHRRWLIEAPSIIGFQCAVYEDGGISRDLFQYKDGTIPASTILHYPGSCKTATIVYPTHVRFLVRPEAT